MLQKTNKPNRQVERTKSWIFEAVMQIMDEKPYDKISVSDITEKAGVARPTFYRNFADKDDVVYEYLMKSFNTELLTAEKNSKQNTIVLIFNYKYMIDHQKNLMKILSISDIENRIFRDLQKYPMLLIESYKKKLSAQDYLICRYKICYQIIGSLRVFADWFVNDMPMPIENMVTMLNRMNNPETVQYPHIPSILVKIKDE